MKITHLLLLPLLVALLVSCEDELTKEEHQQWLDAQYAELIAISESETCTDANKWKITPAGYGVCGGPANYLPYSELIDTIAFKAKVEAYNRSSKAYINTWYKDVVCCMIYLPPPTGVKCVNQKAELIYNHGCNNYLTISSEWYTKATSPLLQINNIQVVDHCLQVNYSSSGCNGDTWALELIDSGEIMESDPPQRNLRFNFINTETCQANFEKEISYSLSALQVEGDKIILHIEGWDNAIIYEY